MWTALGALCLIAYVPGALLFRLPAGQRASRAELPAEERAFWSVILSVAWSSLVTLALAAFGFYTFRRLLAANTVLSLLIALGWRQRLRLGPTAPRPTPTALIPIALVALGVWLFFPGSEYLIGGKDPGTYFNEGIQIAQRGRLVIEDKMVTAIPAHLRGLFFAPPHDHTYVGLRFMGFFVRDYSTGAVIGQFPHLFPAWLAIGYGLDGLTGARLVTGWWAIAGLLAVYFFGTRLFGRTVAATAATLLALNVVQVWFARYPNSEVATQALVFAALLAFARSRTTKDGFFDVVAGVLFGLLLFLRIDAFLVLAGLGLGAVLGLPELPLPRRWCLVPLTLLTCLASWYLLIVMEPYSIALTGQVGNLEARHLVLLFAGGGIAIWLAIALRRRAFALAARAWIPRALAVLVTVAAAYAYFLRAAGGTLAAHDAAALRSFTWYVTRPGLIAAVIGLALAAERLFWRDPAFFATVTVYAFAVFYKIRVVPEHFWMARRFLPVILPSTMLFASSLLWYRLGRQPTVALENAEPSDREAHRWAWLRVARRSVTWAAAVLLPLTLTGLLAREFARASRPLSTHIEYAGVIPRVEAIASAIGDRDVVVVESRNSADTHVLAVPLAYVYARNVLVLTSPRPDRQRFREFLEWAGTRYDNVYFIGGGGTDLLSRSIGVEPVSSERFQIPEYESLVNRYPTRVRFKEFDFSVYRFVRTRREQGWFSLDVGRLDDLLLLRFHAKERSNQVTFRWTRNMSYISLVGLGADQRLVTLWLNDGRRPPTIEPARVAVFFNDVPVGEAIVGPGFRPYSFAIPGDLARAAAEAEQPAVLKIVSNTWNPSRALGTVDDRELGVMVDRVEVR